MRGSSWTHCTRTSRCTRIRARSLAPGRGRESFRSACPSRTGRGRARKRGLFAPHRREHGGGGKAPGAPGWGGEEHAGPLPERPPAGKAGPPPAVPADEPYLKLSGITKRFGKFTALSGIALAVERS